MGSEGRGIRSERSGRECFQDRGVHCELGGGPIERWGAIEGSEKRGHQVRALGVLEYHTSAGDFKGLLSLCPWPSVCSLCDTESNIRHVSFLSALPLHKAIDNQKLSLDWREDPAVPLAPGNPDVHTAGKKLILKNPIVCNKMQFSPESN